MKIVTKNIGNRKYYYLKYSKREGNKIITKEKYIGRKIPSNINEITLKFKKTISGDINNKLKTIKKNFQTEWKNVPKSAKKRELEEISIAFTYNTNAIEGSTITLEETREIIKEGISPNKPLRDVRETEAHSKVFLRMLDKKEEMTNKTLLRWHKEIFGETKPDIAGIYRNYLVRVGPYLAPDWQEVEEMMNKLIEFVNENKKMNPVELSARAHYKFEKIHPFGDGNGRIGRLIINYLLWHNCYPMIIVEYKKRKSYYKALQKDEEGFVSYFLRRYLSVHKKRISTS